MLQALQSFKLDSMAIGLSALCILHCLALPLLMVWAPAFTVLAEQEWVHQLMVCLALLASMWAVFKSGRGRFAAIFTMLVSIGLVALVAGAFIEPLHDHETALTVFGAILISFSHIFRWHHHLPLHQ